MTTESEQNINGSDAGTEQLYRLIRIDYPKRKKRIQNKKQDGPGQKDPVATRGTIREVSGSSSTEPATISVPQKPHVIPVSPSPESETMVSPEPDTPGSPVTTGRDPLPAFPETRTGDAS